MTDPIDIKTIRIGDCDVVIGPTSKNKTMGAGKNLSDQFDKLEGVDLSHGEFARTRFTNSHLDRARFYKANAPEADFRSASLDGADFRYANVAGADFARSRVTHFSYGNGPGFYQTVFRNANLSGANFTNALLSGTDFDNANVAGANFTGADLYRSSFLNARVEGADFTNSSIFEDASYVGDALREESRTTKGIVVDLRRVTALFGPRNSYGKDNDPRYLPPGLRLVNPCEPVAPAPKRFTNSTAEENEAAWTEYFSLRKGTRKDVYFRLSDSFGGLTRPIKVTLVA